VQFACHHLSSFFIRGRASSTTRGRLRRIGPAKPANEDPQLASCDTTLSPDNWTVSPIACFCLRPMRFTRSSHAHMAALLTRVHLLNDVEIYQIQFLLSALHIHKYPRYLHPRRHLLCLAVPGSEPATSKTRPLGACKESLNHERDADR
jgi:hypothetical protein